MSQVRILLAESIDFYEKETQKRVSKNQLGELSERPKEHDWKSCRRCTLSQGFESLTLRFKIAFRPVGQVVKTPPFHGGITGSNPVRVMSHLGGLAQLGEHLPYKQRVSGSIPLTSIEQFYNGLVV